ALDVVFAGGRLAGGELANNGWLQELPQNGTSVVWDNPALVSPRTAEALGLLPRHYPEPFTHQYPGARMARITVDGRTVEMPVWILPGMADETVILTVGYGRSV